MEDGNAAPKKKIRKNHPEEPRADLSLAAPVSLVRELDNYCAVRGTDRSKTVRAALRMFLDSGAPTP